MEDINVKPKLIFDENGEPFVTDGYIMGSKFIVKQQPSKEVVDRLHKFFIEQVKRELEKDVL